MVICVVKASSEYQVIATPEDLTYSGKVEPTQEKLVVLGLALNVNEAWLMGFDVPMERKDTAKIAKDDFDFYYKYSLLDDRDKKIVMNTIDFMISNKVGH